MILQRDHLEYGCQDRSLACVCTWVGSACGQVPSDEPVARHCYKEARAAPGDGKLEAETQRQQVQRQPLPLSTVSLGKVIEEADQSVPRETVGD